MRRLSIAIFSSTYLFISFLPLTSSSKLQLKCRAIFFSIRSTYVWHRWKQFNELTCQWEDTYTYTHMYYTWNHTRFLLYSRTNGIWNILFQLDAEQWEQKIKEEHRENKQSNKTCTFIHNYYFCKIIRQSISAEWVSTYIRICIYIAWNTTKLFSVLCVLLLEMKIYECNLQHIQIDFFLLSFICV